MYSSYTGQWPRSRLLLAAGSVLLAAWFYVNHSTLAPPDAARKQRQEARRVAARALAQQTQPAKEKESKKESKKDVKETVKETVKEIKETVKETVKETKETVKETKEEFKKTVKETKETAELNDASTAGNESPDSKRDVALPEKAAFNDVEGATDSLKSRLLDDASDVASTGSSYKLDESVTTDDSVSISSTGSQTIPVEIAPIPATPQPVPDLDEISSVPSDRQSDVADVDDIVQDIAEVTDDDGAVDDYSIDAVLTQVQTAAAEDEDAVADETQEDSATKEDLLEWEAVQREAEAEAAKAEAAKEAAAKAEQEDADSLEALLATVEGTSEESGKDASLDKTEKATAFWGEFEEKTKKPEGETDDAAGSEGDGDDVDGEATPEEVLEACQTELPARFQDYSTSGVVKKGHVDIDSEDEEDEELADTVISGSSRFDVGFADTKGIRSTMEDEMVVYGTFRDSPDEDYVAVFDGHGGSEASAVAAEELHELLATHLDEHEYSDDPGGALKRAFESCQRTIEQAEPTIQSGTTAVVAYFQKDQGWVANAGDSRAVLCRKTGTAAGDVQVKRVTTDHKPSLPAEEMRIKAAGGFVTRTQTKRGEVSRVCAILGVARALGDTFLQPMVTYVPDIFDVSVGDYDVLILACDGLWDVVTDREAAIAALSANDAGEAARRLRDFAFCRGSDDNISVLVVRFKTQD